jgi:hypothetical protein
MGWRWRGIDLGLGRVFLAVETGAREAGERAGGAALEAFAGTVG